MRWLSAAIISSIALSLTAVSRGQKVDWSNCAYCSKEEPYQDVVKEAVPKEEEISPHSDVHVLWGVGIEVVGISEDVGGWEPISFHEDLAKEAIRGWADFRDRIAPGLPKTHALRKAVEKKSSSALNDSFFKYQKALFEAGGDMDVALKATEESVANSYQSDMLQQSLPSANTSWPEMNALPAYQRLRKYMQYFARRYLNRVGLTNKTASTLPVSLFNWAGVHGPGEYHGPHTHIGEYVVSVFYAQNGPAGGKIRFADPRGGSTPFGKHYFFNPMPGQLILFPSWLSHMATVTGASSNDWSGDDKSIRVTIPFNVGPLEGPLPCKHFWSDPTAKQSFHRRSKIDVKGLLGSLDSIKDAA